jgi:hypothetical protein
MRECTDIHGAYSRTASAPAGVTIGAGAHRVREQVKRETYINGHGIHGRTRKNNYSKSKKRHLQERIACANNLFEKPG